MAIPFKPVHVMSLILRKYFPDKIIFSSSWNREGMAYTNEIRNSN